MVRKMRNKAGSTPVTACLPWLLKCLGDAEREPSQENAPRSGRQPQECLVQISLQEITCRGEGLVNDLICTLDAVQRCSH